jgi:hypothetical protein
MTVELRELLAQSKGSIRLLAEELEAGGDPLDVARRLHEGADYLQGALRRSPRPEAPESDAT